MVESNLDDHAAAVRSLSRAIELDPTDARAWFAKGMSCHALGDVMEAKHCLTHFMQMPNADGLMRSTAEMVLAQLRHVR
jgi:Flp pilus assembly protein TadD